MTAMGSLTILLNLGFIATVLAIPIRSDKYDFGVNGNCTFDNSFCNWHNANSGDNFDWLRHKGATPSSSTGPSKDASTNGLGHYLYIESSHPRKKGETASLIVGPLIGVLCMHFSYHMYGQRVGDMQIFMSERGPVGQTFVWAKYGNQKNLWHTDKVTVYGFAYDILVVARVGSDYTSDIAIDEISFVPGTCFPDENPEELLLRRLGGANNSTEVKGSCDFDGGMCGWSQDILDDVFDWTVGSAGTPTENTGPKKDHGGKDGGKFLYIETSSPRRKGDKARLLSPQLCGQVCVRFYYHMYGSSVGKLSVLRKDGINKEDDRLWFKQGNKGNVWQRAIVEMNSDQDCYQVLFEAQCGQSYYGDMAIDDIYIQKGSCCDMKSELNNLAHTGNCDFSKGSCGWKNLKMDDFDWSLGKGSTKSQLTGPKQGFQGPEDRYAFIEASEPRFIGDTAIMTSGEMLGAMCMRFRYHMYGDEIGTLSVFRNGDGVMQQLLWQQDGNQGDIWQEAEFLIDCNVTAYKVEIEATVGGWRGDIALDDIEFTPGSCPPKPVIIVNYNYTGPTLKPVRKVPEFNGFCSFAKSFCSWKNDLEEDFFDWTRFVGQTPTEGTGPAADYSGEGYFLYIEASIRRPGELARLVSGSIQDKHCLKFQYHMFGDGVGELRVETKDSENGYLWNTTWSVSGSQGNHWNPASITVDGYDYVIGISAVRGSSYLGDIAIDSVDLLKGSCEGSVKKGFFVDAAKKFKLDNCDFDNKDKCQWKDDTKGSFKWTMHRSSTPSSGTGPSTDVSGNGRYLYIEASNPRKEGDEAIIYLDVPVAVCMSFSYHMFGSKIGSLRVSTRNKGQKITDIWERVGQQDDKWLMANVKIEGEENLQVLIVGVVGKGYQGDIAIDEISFKQGDCPQT